MLFALSGCSAKQGTPEGQVVEVVGSDYAFKVPEKIAAGPTVFHFVNNGKVRHELNLFMLARGTTIQQYLDRRKQQKPAQDLIDGPIGVLFAEPGSRSDAGLSADLIPGRDYVAICIFKDQPNGPAHYEMGMYALINAQGPAVPEEPRLAPIRLSGSTMPSGIRLRLRRVTTRLGSRIAGRSATKWFLCA